MFAPMWGPPIPSPPMPRKNQGFALLHTNFRVRSYIAASGELSRYGNARRLGTFASSADEGHAARDRGPPGDGSQHGTKRRVRGSGDNATAVAIYSAIVTALYRRERTGKGSVKAVVAALFDSLTLYENLALPLARWVTSRGPSKTARQQTSCV
jgi:hypothetical protein